MHGSRAQNGLSFTGNPRARPHREFQNAPFVGAYVLRGIYMQKGACAGRPFPNAAQLRPKGGLLIRARLAEVALNQKK